MWLLAVFEGFVSMRNRLPSSKPVVCQISGYTSDLLTVNIPFGAQRKIPVVLHFEYAGFRGQTAPTGSFSAKTLPVGPEYQALDT